MTTETKAVATTSKTVATMQTLIEQYKPHMARLLGKHVDVEQMFQIALLALGRNPKLMECTGASVLGCVLESSRLRLQAGAGAGETWFIPFKNKNGNMECQLIIDYRALIKLMKRGADVGAIIAEAVCEQDIFDYGVDGSKQFLKWNPAKGNRGKVLGYVAATWDTKERLTAVVYKSMEDIIKFHKNRSKAKDFGPWKEDEDAMCKKTVIRATAKLNPYSTEDLTRAVALDEMAELGKPQNLALLADPTEKPIEAEVEKTYSLPQKAEESQDSDDTRTKIHSIEKVDLPDGVAWAIRAEINKEKYYTSDRNVEGFATDALKAGKVVKLVSESRGGKKWIVEIQTA